MKTNDSIDSYDVYRGIFQNPELSKVVTIPKFPYETDPDPNIHTDGGMLTPGARAGLTAYYRTYIQNVAKLTPQQINQSLVIMGLTPNARADLGRNFLVTEVERRINQELSKRGTGSTVTFLDLLPMLAVIIGPYKE